MDKKYRILIVILCAIVVIGAFLSFPHSRTILVTAVFQNAVQKTEIATPINEKKPIKLLFVGDIMLDRHIREAAAKQKSPCFPFTQLTEFLNSFDAVVGNNEGAITNNISLSVHTLPEERNNFMFTFDPGVLECYIKNNIQIVSLGNNHSLNFGKEGIGQTVQNLQTAGIAFFGNPVDENQNAVIKKINNQLIAFVSYNYAFGSKPEVVNAQIAALRKTADSVIVYAHWGAEYVQTANAMQRSLGRSFIDSGADLVIGTHPHVIQDEEVYKGKYIFYSLGNFIFDQYFSEETKRGMGVGITIASDNTMAVQKFFFQNKTNGQVVLSAAQ